MNSNDLKNQADLLERMASGDERAFGEVCAHFRPILYGIIFRLTNQQWRAEEIVQDVFLKIWLKRLELPAIENFGGWVYTIAGNLTLNALKKSEREKRNAENWLQTSLTDLKLTDDIPDPEEFYWELLRAAVDRLPPRQQATYRLIKEQHMKREDAAKMLKISPETVKWNLEQALRSIRAYCMSKMDGLCLLIIFMLIRES